MFQELNKNNKKEVILAAPTGRAAKRMSETSGREAKTIHRLLEMGYATDSEELQFMKNEEDPITADVIIMKAVLQVVSHATVRVEGEVTGQIDKGLLVFLGVAEEDEQTDLDKIVKKVTELRIFKDDAGKTNLSLQDVGGGLLVVSQFTLLADCKKGRRPSFVKAGNPQKAEEMYEEFIRVCKEKVSKVEHGVFGANMKVELLNDGPFTIVLDSKEL